LLRLYHGDDGPTVDKVVGEIRSLLEHLDDANEARSTRLDVGAGYARWSSRYDLPGNPLVAQEQPVVRAMVAELPGEPVLDAGCGTGRHFVWLAELGRQVVGVDQSPEMLALAREKQPDADLRLGDLSNLPVAAGSIAGAVSALAVEHVGDLAAFYGELARAVVPGGWLVVSTLHPVMAQVFGWNAWFVDEDGRAEVVGTLHQVSDHLNAAVTAGWCVEELREVPLQDVEHMRSASEIPIGARIAYDGVPLVLIMRFSRR